MSDFENESERKYKILEEKYKALRRKHKKLAGVALGLAEALEAFIKEDEKPDISKVLVSCSKMYPGLVGEAEGGDGGTREVPEIVVGDEPNLVVEEVDKEKDGVENGEPGGEEEKPEKEYYEGFWSRPKIPRTPQV